MTFAELLAAAIKSYAAIGLLFAAAFVLAGAPRIDPAARATSTGFRLMILPGTAALWPLLLYKWVRS